MRDFRGIRGIALCALLAMMLLQAWTPAASAQGTAVVAVNGDSVGPVAVSVNEVVNITGTDFPEDSLWTWYLILSYTGPCEFNESSEYHSGAFPSNSAGEISSLLTIPDRDYSAPFVGFTMDYGALDENTNCVLLNVEGEVAPPTATPTEAPSGNLELTVNGGVDTVVPDGAPPPVVEVKGLAPSGEFMDVNIYEGYGCVDFYETRSITSGGVSEYAFNQGFDFQENSIQVDGSVSGLSECVNVTIGTAASTVAPTDEASAEPTDESPAEPTEESPAVPTEELAAASPVAPDPDEGEDTVVVVLPSTGSGNSNGSLGLVLIAMSTVALVASVAVRQQRRTG